MVAVAEKVWRPHSGPAVIGRTGYDAVTVV